MTGLRKARFSLSFAILAAVCAGTAGRARAVEAGEGVHLKIVPESFPGGEDIRSIDLAWVVDRALDRSPDLALARAEDRIAGAEYSGVRARLFPSVEVEAGGGRVDGLVQGSFGEFREVRYDTYSPSIGLVYRSDPGADLLYAMSRNKAKQAAALDLIDMERKVLLTVAGFYLNLLRAQATQVASERMEELGNRFLVIAREREASGVGSGADAALAEANSAETRMLRADAEEEWRAAAVQLSVAIGEDPAVFLVSGDERLVPWALLDADGVDRGVVNAVHVRSDLLSAHRSAEAARLQAKSALLGFLLPDVEGSVRRLWIGDDLEQIDERDDLSVRLFWSFGFRPAAEIGEARAREEASRIREQRLEIEIRGAIAALRRAVSVGAERVEAAAVRLAALNRSLEIQIARYEAGAALGIEVLEAESLLMDAYRQVGEVITKYNLSQVELLAAEGRLTAGVLRGNERSAE